MCASVCAYEREVTGSHSTQGKEVFLSLHRWTWTIQQTAQLTRLATAPATTKVSCFERMAAELFQSIVDPLPIHVRVLLATNLY